MRVYPKLSVALLCGLWLCSSLFAACSDEEKNSADGTGGTGAVLNNDDLNRFSSGQCTVEAADQDCGDVVDIVFVLDVSTSMSNEIQAVIDGIDQVICTAETLAPNPQFSLVVFVDEVLAVDDCEPFDSIDELQTQLSESQWLTQTENNKQPTSDYLTNSKCEENTLDALYETATTCPWRENASRIIVHITDDTFATEGKRLATGEDPETQEFVEVRVENSYEDTVAALKEARIRVASFAVKGVGDCFGGSNTPVDLGFHEPFENMEAIPEATQGNVWDLREARSGEIDMTGAISDFVEEVYCEPLLE